MPYTLIQELSAALIGKTEQEARHWCRSRGYNLRIAQKDDNAFQLGFDVDHSRINVKSWVGKITEVQSVG